MLAHSNRFHGICMHAGVSTMGVGAQKAEAIEYGLDYKQVGG